MIETYAKAFGLGVIIGMRALAGPALLSRKLVRIAPVNEPQRPVDYFIQPPVATGLAVLAATEIITDKLPGVPNRTVPFQFVGRLLSGGSCGAVLSEVEGESILAGSVAGGVGAVAGTLVTFHLRQWLTHTAGLPNSVVALAEDMLCVGAGWAIVNTIEPAQKPAY